MDTSSTYVEMCKEAVEIQSLKPLIKDRWEDGNYIFCSEEEIFITFTDSELGPFPNEPHQIWLPRQDQLQQMIKLEYREIQTTVLHRTFFKFREYVQNYDPDSWGDFRNEFTSFEQLWLAFVMETNYNKYWNGEDWLVSQYKFEDQKS
jgi:hypothetical protein